MNFVDKILEQTPANSTYFDEFRKILLQIDRETSRKKSIAGLMRLKDTVNADMRPYIYSGLAMASFHDNDYARSLFWLKEATNRFPLSPLALYCATLTVLIYRILGMKRERFEAESSRLLIMKKIAMQSDNPNHRIIALNELKDELEARDLHDEAHKCTLELNYWYSFLKKKSTPKEYRIAIRVDR